MNQRVLKVENPQLKSEGGHMKEHEIKEKHNSI